MIIHIYLNINFLIDHWSVSDQHFLHIKIFDEVYNINDLNHQNELKTRLKILELQRSVIQFKYVHIVFPQKNRLNLSYSRHQIFLSFCFSSFKSLTKHSLNETSMQKGDNFSRKTYTSSVSYSWSYYEF